MSVAILQRERKSEFVRMFTKTPPGVVCPQFFELILSNGCPFGCSYCYLQLTFRGNKRPVLFSNNWNTIERELDAAGAGVFSTGELADSLAVIPPNLERALDYFSRHQNKYLLLVTKSTNVDLLLSRKPSDQVIVSFSVNADAAAVGFERLCPSPARRLEAAQVLKSRGWRVRIRLDPVITEVGLERYRQVCQEIARLQPERVTVGTLRQYPGLHNFAPSAPRRGLVRSDDGRMRYPLDMRVKIYEQLACWLGFEPALCKETEEVWRRLGWNWRGCNCTV